MIGVTFKRRFGAASVGSETRNNLVLSQHQSIMTKGQLFALTKANTRNVSSQIFLTVAYIRPKSHCGRLFLFSNDGLSKCVI